MRVSTSLNRIDDLSTGSVLLRAEEDDYFNYIDLSADDSVKYVSIWRHYIEASTWLSKVIVLGLECTNERPVLSNFPI